MTWLFCYFEWEVGIEDWWEGLAFITNNLSVFVRCKMVLYV